MVTNGHEFGFRAEFGLVVAFDVILEESGGFRRRHLSPDSVKWKSLGSGPSPAGKGAASSEGPVRRDWKSRAGTTKSSFED